MLTFSSMWAPQRSQCVARAVATRERASISPSFTLAERPHPWQRPIHSIEEYTDLPSLFAVPTDTFRLHRTRSARKER